MSHYLMAICKLCLQDKLLLKKSHIIPDFLYSNMYDENHKLESFKPNSTIKIENAYIQRPSSGEYESGLLCSDCDGRIISGYESYAKKTIYGKNIPIDEAPICKNYQSTGSSSPMYSVCENVDYTKFKLFLLSILWRASISSRPFFSEVILGPHENIIRKMILEGNPGGYDEYLVVMGTYIKDRSAIEIVAQPIQRKLPNGVRAYQFIIDKLLFLFCVKAQGHILPEPYPFFTIKPSNQLAVFQIPPGKGWDLILGHYGLNRYRRK